MKIYRLLTRNTYEATMFDRASKKLAIEMTVLGGSGPAFGNGQKDQRNPQELEELLRRGAYGFLTDGAGDDAARVFCESNIQDLLAVRALASRARVCVCVRAPICVRVWEVSQFVLWRSSRSATRARCKWSRRTGSPCSSPPSRRHRPTSRWT